MVKTELITKKLDDKIAVITGGNSGIGLATAQRFVAEGAYVFITGRRESEVDVAVGQIGKKVTGIQDDVSNLADLDRLYATVKEQKRPNRRSLRQCRWGCWAILTKSRKPPCSSRRMTAVLPLVSNCSSMWVLHKSK